MRRRGKNGQFLPREQDVDDIITRIGTKDVFGTDQNRLDKPDEGFSVTSRFYNPIILKDTSRTITNPTLNRFEAGK